MPVKRALKANAGDQEMLKNSAPPILDARLALPWFDEQDPI